MGDPAAVPVRCPHCRNPIEVAEESSSRDVVCDTCGERFGLLGDARSTSPRPERKLVQQFELLDLLGNGAFGTVWSARDTRLDRVVAIKIPRKNSLGPDEEEQFLREAQAAGGLRHPNIVSVHEVGLHEDVLYIASDFIQGVDLADWILERRATPREAAELCARVADALEHAHSRGVIHRDLKPSNIMMDAEGVPHLMDFGLAKRDAAAVTMTVSGKLLGTPAYMPPEQARGDAHAADARSDVYSLGVILFELLTGERPFRGSTRMLLHQVLTEEAPSPRRLNGNVPRDLETVCLKCLEKSPDRRYRSAADLRDDLNRFLRREPVVARPVGRLTRGWRWCRRKPVAAALCGLVALLAVVGPVVAFKMTSLARAERAARKEERRIRQEAERNLYVSLIALAHHATEVENNVVHALRLLKECVPAPDEPDLRGFEWYYLLRECEKDKPLSTFDVGDAVNSIALSPDGQMLAVACGQKWLRPGNDVAVWNLVDEGRMFGIDEQAGSATWMDNETLAVAGLVGDARLWDVLNRRVVRGLPVSENRTEEVAAPVRMLVGTKGGEWIVAVPAGKTNTPLIWNSREGRPTTLRGEATGVMAAAISHDARVLACAHWNGDVSLWSLIDGAPWRARIRHEPGFIATSVAFSPNGQLLAVGGEGGAIRLWNLDGSDHSERRLDGHTLRVTSLAFVDADRLASGSADKTMRLWDLSSDESRIYKGHGGGVECVIHDPHRNRLMTGGGDGTVKAWPLDRRATRDRFQMPKLTHNRRQIEFSPDGEALLVASRGTMKRWNLHSEDELPGAWGKPLSVMYSPDGRLMATTEESTDGSHVVHLYDAATLERLALIPGRGSCFTHDNRRLICGGDGLRQWDISDPTRPSSMESIGDDRGHEVNAIAFPDRNRIVIAKADDSVLRIWDLTSNASVAEFDVGAPPVSGCIFPDGTHGCVGTHQGEIQVWNTDKQVRKATYVGHGGPVWSLDVSPDGRTLASGGADGTLKLWNLATGALLMTYKDHTGMVMNVRFSRGGRFLASGSVDGTILLRRAGGSSNEDSLTTLANRPATFAVERFLVMPGITGR